MKAGRQAIVLRLVNLILILDFIDFFLCLVFFFFKYIGTLESIAYSHSYSFCFQFLSFLTLFVPLCFIIRAICCFFCFPFSFSLSQDVMDYVSLYSSTLKAYCVHLSPHCRLLKFMVFMMSACGSEFLSTFLIGFYFAKCRLSRLQLVASSKTSA